MSRIMVIDDDAANRDLLRARLELAGHEMLEASNGEEGLKTLETTVVDLVFLDVMMPKFDGWSVCRSLKANPATRAVPVVLLTALGQQIDELRGFECGADDFIVKPWDPTHLKSVVDKLLAAGGKK